MKKLFIFLLIFNSIQISAQEITRKFNLKDFQNVHAGSAMIITIVKGSNYKIELKGREQDIEDIVAKVEGGKLIVGYPNSWKNWKNRKNVYLDIVMPTLTGAYISGACTAKVNGFSNESMKISISGASTGSFDVDADNLAVDVSGASQLKLIGKGKILDLDVSGASTFNGYEFTTKDADIDASGASGVKAFVSEKATADASGASSIVCKGGGRLKSNTSGASSAKMMD